MNYDVDYIKKLWFANRNHISWRFYMGIKNQENLTAAGFSTPEWLTFNQARKNWLKIKPWSKGVVVQHKDVVEIKEEKSDWGVEIKKIPQIKSWLLFNLEQIETMNN